MNMQMSHSLFSSCGISNTLVLEHPHFKQSTTSAISGVLDAWLQVPILSSYQ